MKRDFGWLRKLPSNKYQASFPHPGRPGERVKAPSTFTHKADAERWLRMQERAIERGEWISPEEEAAQRPQSHTLRETYDRFLSQRPRPLALSTSTAYEQDWRLRIVPHWGEDRDVKTITHDQVWEWRQGPLGQERRRDRSTLALFHELLGKALHWGWIEKNPATGVSIPRRTKAMGERHVFDLDDVRRYLQAADPQHVAMLAAVALGGLRSGEVRGLRRMDIDLDGKRILVRQAVEFGKEGEEYRVGIKEPKTSSGVRALPMPGTLVKILGEYLRLHPGEPGDLVFTVSGGKPMGPAEADRRHNRALANMGLRTPEAERRRLWRRGSPVPKEDHITLHDLRASYAAWLFSEGYTIAEVMLLLGWSDSRMALEVYSRVFPRRVESVGPKQDAALEGLSVTVEYTDQNEQNLSPPQPPSRRVDRGKHTRGKEWINEENHRETCESSRTTSLGVAPRGSGLHQRPPENHHEEVQ